MNALAASIRSQYLISSDLSNSMSAPESHNRVRSYETDWCLSNLLRPLVFKMLKDLKNKYSLAAL